MNGAEVFGSDSDEESCKASESNLKWLFNEYNIQGKYKIKNIDVLEIKKFSRKFDAVITEPYFGPPLRKSVSESETKRIITELEELYKNTLNILAENLKNKKRIVMTFPVNNSKRDLHF